MSMSIDVQTKVELNIPQLTLAKIAQLNGPTKVLGSQVQSLLEVNFC